MFCTGKWNVVNYKHCNKLPTSLTQGSGFSYTVKIYPEVIWFNKWRTVRRVKLLQFLFSMVIVYLFMVNIVLWYWIYLFSFKQDWPTVHVILDMTLIMIFQISMLPWWFFLIDTLHSPSTFDHIFSIISKVNLLINSGGTFYAFLCCFAVAYFMWNNSKSYCISFSVNHIDGLVLACSPRLRYIVKTMKLVFSAYPISKHH